MAEITKKDLVHKLHIQHKNDRHDACDIVLKYQAEIEKYNKKLWSRCQIPPIFEKDGKMASGGYIYQQKYDYEKKVLDPNEITRRLMNMKQRKPKDGE